MLFIVFLELFLMWGCYCACAFRMSTRIWDLGALESQCSNLFTSCPHLERWVSARSTLRYKFILGGVVRYLARRVKGENVVCHPYQAFLWLVKWRMHSFYSSVGLLSNLVTTSEAWLVDLTKFCVYCAEQPTIARYSMLAMLCTV